MQKIHIGAVSYLNTKPLIKGFPSTFTNNEIDLNIYYPAKLSDLFFNKLIDIGLLPTAFLHKFPNTPIIKPYCIASNNSVASVAIFSDVPINQIKHIYLDFQSNTSVALLKILLLKYWHINPTLLPAPLHFINLIHTDTAALVIGDRALQLLGKKNYVYDLGEAWFNFSHLPFVFAAWFSNIPLADNFIEKFNAANNMGLQQIPNIINENPFNNYDLNTYYTKNIHYILDDEKLKGLALFLQLMNEVL